MKLTNKEASEWLIAIKRDYIYGGDEDYDKRRKLALDMGAEALENQKTGHWIAEVDKWGDVVTTINGYKCSVCGGKRTGKTGDWIQIHDCKYPYCPDCGAKMEGVKQ